MSAKSLKAGVATVNITPPVGCYLQGYTRGKPSIGIYDDLYAKAVVFDDSETKAAIVATDLIGFEYDSIIAIREYIEQTTDIPGKNVMVAASHTHAGPAVMNLGGDPTDESYVRELEKKIAGVVRMAVSELQPVTIGVGIGEMDFNINRRLTMSPGVTPMLPNPDGIVDRRVKVMRVDAGADTPLAVLMQYVCHATVFGGTNLYISGDYPGRTQRFVEHAYNSGTTALFLQGCCGNIRPHLVTEDGHFRAGSPAELDRIGRRLGAEVVKVCESIQTQPVSGIAVASKLFGIPYDELPTETALRESVKAGQNVEWAEMMLKRLEAGELKPEVEIEIQVMKLDGTWFVTLPGEPFLEIGLQIEEKLDLPAPSEARQAGGNVFVVGYANGNVGYLCTAASYPEGGYEPVGSYKGYFQPAQFRPETEQLLVNTAHEIAQQLR
jgi:hypothetical protein